MLPNRGDWPGEQAVYGQLDDPAMHRSNLFVIADNDPGTWALLFDPEQTQSKYPSNKITKAHRAKHHADDDIAQPSSS